MPRPSLPGALVALVVLLAACAPSGSSGSGAPPASPGGSGAAAACPTAPEPANLPESWSPSSDRTVTPVIVSSRVVCGDARIVFLFVDEDDQVVSAPDRTATVAFYNLARDPETAVGTVDAEFTWGIPDSRGMYTLTTTLPEAGIWGAEFTTAAPGAASESIRMQFQVADSTPTVRVGQHAPASDTPTLEDVGGDVTQISTDDEPVEAFYETSVADALEAGKPFLLAFATPKFCVSAQCGPTLEKLKPVAEAHPDLTFINVEPYQLQLVDGQLQPVTQNVNGQPQLVATEASNEWGLLSEPWIFVVDGSGVVRGSFEGVAAEGELERALEAAEAGA